MKTKKTYKQIEECAKCKGTGRLPQFNHRQGGVCYECGGVGKVEVTYSLNPKYKEVFPMVTIEDILKYYREMPFAGKHIVEYFEKDTQTVEEYEEEFKKWLEEDDYKVKGFKHTIFQYYAERMDSIKKTNKRNDEQEYQISKVKRI